MSKNRIGHKCDEIEGMFKALRYESKTGKLNISELALDQVWCIVGPALKIIRTEETELLDRIAELEERLKPKAQKGGPVLVDKNAEG